MERDLGGGSDYGSDLARELNDEPPESIRDAPPDILSPIDADSPVSGHTPIMTEPGAAASLAASMAPEHDFGAAAALIFPAFRPVGTQGVRITEVDTAVLSEQGNQSHAQPLLDDGPCGLPVVYAIAAGGFDVIVNGDHLLSWGVPVTDIQDAAIRNLAAWSATAAWTDEVSGDRRLLSSETGEGSDAVRILLPEVREHLTRELGGSGRVLIGLPERHLLLAGTLRAGDEEFAALFADFVLEHSGGSDEPIDRRVFELVGGQLVEFAS
jgi:hypothetical protein